jgi:hypothetical protein
MICGFKELEQVMKSAVIRWLVIAIVIGFAITALNQAVWIKQAARYEPPITEAEIKTYDARPIADLESFMKSREVHMTRVQVLSDDLRSPRYWRWLSENSVVPACGVFITLLIGVAMDRRQSSPPKH